MATLEQDHEIATKKLHCKYQARQEEAEHEAAAAKNEAVARAKRGLVHTAIDPKP